VPEPGVPLMDAATTARDFFEEYARTLLARDAAGIAAHYAVPALILFPGQSIPVNDAAQTEQFFVGAFAQYEGVTAARAEVRIAGEAPHSIWADVTWRDEGAAGELGHAGTARGEPARGERMMYQLVRAGDDWRIAVLT